MHNPQADTEERGRKRLVRNSSDIQSRNNEDCRITEHKI
jgi:hypothetical protein